MSVSRGLQRVRERIADAALRSRRSPDSITLVGCKPDSVDDVLQAVAAGLVDIGENRVQVAAAKISAVAERSSFPVRWHLIGHLQTNKGKLARKLFDTIHSIDSTRLAETLSQGASRTLPIFIEVQFVHQPDRFGFSPDTVVDAFDTIAALPGLTVRGLMTVAPLGLDESGTRSVFRNLREIRDQIQENHPERPPLGLSMGMTDDYEVAIEEGATVVRIGRAIFAA